MSISKHIQVSSAYTRSINIERDSQSDTFDSSYIPTSRALRTLGTISSRFSEGDQPRAWSLVGPYGSGKSSFALFLSELLDSPKSDRAIAARKLLNEYDSELESVFTSETDGTEGYAEVLISGTPERLSLRYLRGLQYAIQNYWQGRKGKKPAVFSNLEKYVELGEVSVSELITLTKACQDALSKIGCPGIMIVFDEFGKFLEYESRFLGVNDVFLLQALAEHAHSAHSTRILVLVLLHQSIEQYARGVGESLKNEWAKIQGRFEEIPFLESAEQTLRIVKAAINHKDITDVEETTISDGIKAPVSSLMSEGVLPSSIKENEAIDLFKGLYPLHPTSAVVLPLLCQLISQNERTLFSYLGSREQSGFKYMLDRISSLGEFILPDHIFDYFLANQPSVNGDYLTQRRWAESVSVIERLPEVTETELAVLKTIGLINLLGNRGGVRASELVLKSVYGKKTKVALDKLQKSSAVVHRKFNNEYRVWQGSDFDLETRLQDQLNQLGPYSLAEKITKNQSLAPLVARKYSIEKGALRYFTLTFIDALNYQRVEAQKNPQIFIFLSAGQDDHRLYEREARDHLAKFGLVAYSEGGQTLRSLVSERLALEEIEITSKELAEDPVARKEFGTRMAAIRQAELRHVTQLVTNPQNSVWYFGGEELVVRNRRDFQEQLSNVLVKIYPKAPEIHNELINRDKPSSQAIAARNKLLNLMLSSAELVDLGISKDKFPPEKAIYRSVLKETKIHRQDAGEWILAKPLQGSSLLPAWELVEDFFASTEKEARPFSEINAELISPPYGVKAGVLPILWLAVYLVNEHELALYEERQYVPGFTVERLERFVKRPDQFYVQRFKIEGLKASLFKQYSYVVSRGAKPSNVLDIAKPLASFMGELPSYTLKTKVGLSTKAIALRTAFNLSKSPEQLIFEGMPKALGFKELTDDHSEEQVEGFSEVLTETLRELKNAHSKLVESFKAHFAESLGLDAELNLAQLREQSIGRCIGLENYTLDIKGVKGLLTRINRTDDSDEQWFENILMFLGAKPTKAWTDADDDEAKYKLNQLSRRLVDLFSLALEELRHKDNSDQNFDVYLLKSLKKGEDFIDEVVTVDKSRAKLTSSVKQNIEQVLASHNIDKDTQLAALAQVVDGFLKSYRKSQSQAATDLDDSTLKVSDKAINGGAAS